MSVLACVKKYDGRNCLCCLNGDSWCMRVSIVVMIASLRNLEGVYIPVGRMRSISWLVIVLQGGCSEICVGG